MRRATLMHGSTLSDRQAIWAFVLGCLAVTAGVAFHLPMFLMARSMGYRLADMPMDGTMTFGMVLIVAGVVVAAYGLLPRNLAAQRAAAQTITVSAPEDAPIGKAHWMLMVVLVIALTIDVMKPASLGFTVPGMIAEYGVPKATVSLVPFFALMGTVVGSVLWGVIADIYGRKASILLSAVMFVGTSICGAMPSLAWNIGMCFMMGAAAGGMLPVTYALLAEMMPSRHRGWSLVLVGGLGAAGGYLAASGLSALLQPIFGWRILWLANLPTGLALIALGAFIPESARFLIARGRVAEAERVMRRFGATVHATPAVLSSDPAVEERGDARRFGVGLAGLSVAALTWGLVNFGILLWLPGDLAAKGFSIGAASGLLAQSSLIAFPAVFIGALLYSRWSTKGSLVVMILVLVIGLAGVFRLEVTGSGGIVLPVALLIVGSNGLLAVLLPYASESAPLRIRGRAIGWVAACTKGGGLLAQTLSILALVPAMSVVTASVVAPAVIALVMIAWFGRETRSIDLRLLDAPAAMA
ncbi:MAG: transporter [Sphingomonas bacterium]|uniref:MFS transporter n=1 Tax=Sphingomonas bacterium TaxID=1895847 RepID=UPI00261D953D|nr:MFS transporter [Sphingomonas bacterium]MDB5709802.1 transporter [Sphingomonas bacterium]